MYAIIDKKKRRVYEKDGEFFVYKKIKKQVRKDEVFPESVKKRKSYIRGLQDTIKEKEEEFELLKSAYEAQYRAVLKQAETTVDPSQKKIVQNQQLVINEQREKLSECQTLKARLDSLQSELLASQLKIAAKEQALKEQTSVYEKEKDDAYNELQKKYNKLLKTLDVQRSDFSEQNMLLKSEYEKLKEVYAENLERDKDKFRKALKEDKSSSESLKQELEETTASYKSAMKQLNELRERFAQQEEDISKMDEQIARFIKEKNESLLGADVEKAKVIQLLRKRIEDLETTVSDSKKREEKYRETTESVILSSMDISKKYTECTQKLEKIEPEYEKISKKATGLDKGIKNMTVKMLEHKKRNRELQKQSDSLGSKLIIEKAKLDECNKAIVNFVDERSRNYELFQQYEQKFSQSEKLLNNYRLEKDRLEQQFGDAMNKLAALTIENSENKIELDKCSNLESNFGDAMNRIAKLELYIAEVQEKYEREINEFAKKQHENSDLERSYDRDLKRLAESEMEKSELERAKRELEEKYRNLLETQGEGAEMEEKYTRDLKRLAEIEIEKGQLEENYRVNLKKLEDCVTRAGRLQQDYQDMSEDLSVCREDYTELQAEISGLKMEVQAYKADKENLEALVVSHKENIQDLKRDNKDRGVEIQTLFGENNSLRKQLGDVTSKNAYMIEKNKELQDSIMYLEIEKEEGVGCEDIKKEFEKYKSEVENSMRDYNEQLETLIASNEKCEARTRDLNNKIKELETELALKNEDKNIEYVVQPDIETQEINGNLRRDIMVLQNKVDQLNSENKSLAERGFQSSKEFKEMKEDFEKLILNQETIISDLEAQISELKNLKQEEKAEAETDKEKCYKLSNANSVLTEQMTELQREFDQLNEQFIEQEQEHLRGYASLRNRIAELEKENETLKENDEECERISVKSGESERYERMNEELTLENQSLLEDNEKLKEMLACTVENDSHCQQRMLDCMAKSRGELLEA